MRRLTVLAGAAALAGFGITSVADAVPITVQYEATIATVANSPFGFGQEVRTMPVSGSFTYETGTPDTDVFNDPNRGVYDHLSGGQFSALLPDGRLITGSATPEVQVENFNPGTFRFRDGPGNGQGVMSIDGVPSPSVNLGIAITDGSGAAFNSDDLPDPFPLVTPPGGGAYPYPHTFSLSDSGGTLLLQFTQVVIPEPGGLGAVAALALVALGARRRRRS